MGLYLPVSHTFDNKLKNVRNTIDTSSNATQVAPNAILMCKVPIHGTKFLSKGDSTKEELKFGF